ncbi:hypothetical protein JZ751_005719 [Albula glossodonta]|uniref:Uncharacterized protein n=1 Tax=Albula glossodonta TaxID=121402 RepID=A0A8T2N4V1_9TELE|nr:hypothetical protein JZ751_005719 [Albula glossodonta]
MANDQFRRFYTRGPYPAPHCSDDKHNAGLVNSGRVQLSGVALVPLTTAGPQQLLKSTASLCASIILSEEEGGAKTRQRLRERHCAALPCPARSELFFRPYMVVVCSQLKCSERLASAQILSSFPTETLAPAMAQQRHFQLIMICCARRSHFEIESSTEAINTVDKKGRIWEKRRAAQRSF